MKYGDLSGLDVAVSKVGFGTWQLGGETQFGGRQIGWGATDSSLAVSALKRALDLGVTFFDTADIYGNGRSEELLGEALSEKIHETLVCTKFGNRENKDGLAYKDFSPSWAIKSLDGSLRRLRREAIDIFLLHSPAADYGSPDELRVTLDKQIQLGKLKRYGVSVKDVSGAKQVLERQFGTVIEGIYNVLDRRMEEHVLPEVLRRGLGFIARVPLASGFLNQTLLDTPSKFSESDYRSGLSQEECAWRLDAARSLSFLGALPGGIPCSALLFCLSHPGVLTVIPGMRTPHQVEINAQAGDLGHLEESIIMLIREVIPAPYSAWV